MKKFSYLTVAAVASAIFISCNETSIPSITEYGKDKIVESSKRSLSEAKEIALNATRSLDDGMSRGEAEIRTMTENDVDVVINAQELSDANRAQIEDIITRKTGVSPANIVITPVYTEK